MKGKHKELEPSFKKTPGVGAYEIPSKVRLILKFNLLGFYR